uniref:Uncharacterized protein n=1 Tax=Romanomermis culicivorax TaxID=13658 RepID=A0A915JD40_ROMCU
MPQMARRQQCNTMRQIRGSEMRIVRQPCCLAGQSRFDSWRGTGWRSHSENQSSCYNQWQLGLRGTLSGRRGHRRQQRG